MSKCFFFFICETLRVIIIYQNNNNYNETKTPFPPPHQNNANNLLDKSQGHGQASIISSIHHLKGDLVTTVISFMKNLKTDRQTSCEEKKELTTV